MRTGDDSATMGIEYQHLMRRPQGRRLSASIDPRAHAEVYSQ
jgi:hypothetical protein